MPLQNRVTPFGAIERHPSRGLLTGNRGCLHDVERRVVRDYQVRRWIICVLAFKGRRAELMRPGFYTHLFFLDEATALAAGHRPCAECQHERFLAFRQNWAAANPVLAGSPRPLATTIDEALHRERITGGRRPGSVSGKVTYTAALADLPDGAMVMLPGAMTAQLVLGGRLLRWSFDGYQEPVTCPVDATATVLTPRSIVAALAHGYQPLLHPSALAPLRRPFDVPDP
jgi:hypothetical protein